jgi:8-amino-7-oxononanoate synthase
MTDLFQKCREYTRANDAKAAGVYPYFCEISENRGPKVVMEGREVLMLGSNNYLGLSLDPRVREAAKKAIDEFGTSCSGSRFLNGTLSMHRELEEKLADWLGKEDATVLTTGYQTNTAGIGALVARGDVAVMDTNNHASLYDAVLASGARIKRYKHSDAEDLDRVLGAMEDKSKAVITDGAFSMEGTLAPVDKYVALKEKHDFRLFVDDAHALGVMGPNGRGTAEHFGVHDDVDVITGTFSKCFASIGGVVAGPKTAIDYVKHVGRAMIFSASMSPPQLGAALKSLEIIRSEPEHRERVLANASRMRNAFKEMGFVTTDAPSPVVPIYVGDEIRALFVWRALYDRGVYTNVAIPPGVQVGQSLIRTSYMAVHTDEMLDRALEVFHEVGRMSELLAA